MLELRPICENCGKNLPNESTEAMICSFECTFCKTCVEEVLKNVCPNCGGGLEKRPSRPQEKLLKYPAKTEPLLKPVDLAKFETLLSKNKDIPPHKIKMKLILETERLFLREFELTDTSFIIELLNSPGWLEFIGDRNIKTEADAQNYLQNSLIKGYLLNGYGLSMVVRKEDNACIGGCGIIKRDTLETPDIGFAFLPQYTGMGYAFEIANATLIHATKVLKIPKIAAITLPNNTKSINLLEKIGLRLVKTIIFDAEELLLYSN